MKDKSPKEILPQFDWQGHRGARGILPENTIPAFIKALEFPIKTLELDVVVSKDQKVIVSHEPWMSHHICSKPDGTPVLETDTLLTYDMDYATIQTYDAGMRGNERFPAQQKMKVAKPSFKEMVQTIEQHCLQNNRALPYYNIELKSRPDWYEKIIPVPEKFAALVLQEIKDLGIHARTNLQCFDLDVLKAIHQQDASMSTALLVEKAETFEVALQELKFTPPFFSPYFLTLNKAIVDRVHERGMKVIPWTANETTQMLELIEMGVDGIITDYPNRIETVLDSLQIQK
ncbi:MAG: glycerophosphodiester phosphodiesterase family protein [Saprospiraceae bacterium]